MERAHRGVRRPRKSAPKGGQGGFAVLEVVIAATFLCTVLIGIGSVLGTETLSVTASTSWKVGNGLLTQSMEEVRALPYATLDTGLSDLTTCDSTAPGGSNADSNIQASGSTWTYTPNGETIPHGDLSCTSPQPTQIPPLIPHKTIITLNHLGYTVAVYPTIPSSGPTGMLRITAVVSWKRVGLIGVHQISAQTFVYPPAWITGGGCSGPCQALMTAGAEADSNGSVQVTGTVAGLTFDQLLQALPGANSSMQLQTVSEVSGCAITSGAQAIVAGDPGVPVGESKACTSADNDPGTSAAAWQSKSTSALSSGSLTVTGSLLDTLGVAMAGGDTGSSTSTVAAASTAPSGDQTCNDLTGHAQSTGLPCGASAVTAQGASTLSTALTSTLFGSLGSEPLLAAGAESTPASTFVSQYTSSGSSSSYCDTPSTTSGDGCIHSGATRAFGLVQLAGLPSGLLGAVAGGGLGVAPVGWGLGSANCPAGNYLVALTNYSDTVSAESGIDAGAPTTATNGTPYLCYWNGAGYTATSAVLGSSSPALPINNESFTFTNLTGTVSVAITSNVTLGTATTTSSPSPWAANTASGCWQVPCTAGATITSPIQGSYSVMVSAANILGGPLVPIAWLTVQVDLGELTASTSYQAAPPQ